MIETVTSIRLYCDRCDRVFKDEHNDIVELDDDISAYDQMTSLAIRQNWLFLDEDSCLCPDCQKEAKK